MNTEEKILAILEKHSEMFEKVFSRMDQMQEEQKQMRDDIQGIKLRFELDVDKRFNAVDEGINAILEQLTPKSRVDEMEADIIVLKTAVKMLSQEVAELKKAQ